MINKNRTRSCDKMKPSFKEIYWRAWHTQTDSLDQTGMSSTAVRLLAVSRQQILLLLLPMLKNWTGCQPFGSLNTPSDKPASHDLQTGSVESPEPPPPPPHITSSLHKDHISLPPFHSYANCKSCSSWKSSLFFLHPPFFFSFFSEMCSEKP